VISFAIRGVQLEAGGGGAQKAAEKLQMVIAKNYELVSTISYEPKVSFKTENTKGGLLFDWFGLVCFANKNKNFQLSCS
jgi:hypothetical protein